MPEKHLDQMARVHNVKPSMNGRRVDRKNFAHSVSNGVGVTSGFKVSVTSPASKSIWVTHGLAVGPDGEELRAAYDATKNEADFQKYVRRDAMLYAVDLNLESLSGAFSTLDPASHSLLITLDVRDDRIRVLKITNAEKTAIDAAIAAGETDDANPEFEPATADHRARQRGVFKDPDGVAALVGGVDGVIPTVNAATEYILATAILSGIGGDVSAVTVRRERKQPWADFIVP